MPGKQVKPLAHPGRHGIACIPAPDLALGHGQAFGQVPVRPADDVEGGAVFVGGHLADAMIAAILTVACASASSSVQTSVLPPRNPPQANVSGEGD